MSQSPTSETSTPEIASASAAPSSSTGSASATSSEHLSEGSPARDRANRMARSAAETTQQYAQEYAQHYVAEPAKDLFSLWKDFARDKPDVAAVWCFALGVIVGWKLKP